MNYFERINQLKNEAENRGLILPSFPPIEEPYHVFYAGNLGDFCVRKEPAQLYEIKKEIK